MSASAVTSRILRTSSTLLPSVRHASSKPRTVRYGGRAAVTLVPGDGIGQELAAATKTLFKAINAPIDFQEIPFSGSKLDEDTFNEVISSLKTNRVGLKGLISTPRGKSSVKSYNMRIRQELDLYANVVLCKTIPGKATRHSGVDLVVVRQNTEGEYSNLEHEISPGIMEALKVTSRKEAERIARFAANYAIQNNRKKISAIHKANIMKLGDGLFLESCRSVVSEHHGIQFEGMIVDNASMQMVSYPQQFDVLVTPNLYGTIIGNIGAGLVGGPGVVPGFNMGDDIALFEAGARHAGLDISGKNVANPTGMLRSSALLLNHIGMEELGAAVSQAVDKVLLDGVVSTPDMGGKNTTIEFTDAVIREMENASL